MDYEHIWNEWSDSAQFSGVFSISDDSCFYVIKYGNQYIPVNGSCYIIVLRLQNAIH